MDFAAIINRVARFKIFNKECAIFTHTAHYVMPIHIQLEPTTKCNLNCKICMRSGEVSSDMPFDLFKSIIDQVKYPKFLTRSINLTGLGEPLLNPHIVSMVKYAKEKGLEVSLTSNFTLIDQNKSSNLIKAGLDNIYASIDAASKQKFERIRIGANFEQVIDNVKLFVRTRKELNSKRPTIMFESTISRENIGEIQQLITLAEALGVDGVVFSKHVGVDGISFSKQSLYRKECCANDSSISLDLENLLKSKVKISLGNLRKTPIPCIATRECFITFDGKVLPCGYFMGMVPRKEYSNFQLGDLKYDSLGRVWRTSRYKQLRSQLALGKYPSVCKACPLHSTKKAVHKINAH